MHEFGNLAEACHSAGGPNPQQKPFNAAMPVAYDASKFWGVVFARVGSVLQNTAVMLRSLGMCCVSAAVVTLHHFYPYAFSGFDDTVLIPFQVMVAFVIGFRLNMAFTKRAPRSRVRAQRRAGW